MVIMKGVTSHSIIVYIAVVPSSPLHKHVREERTKDGESLAIVYTEVSLASKHLNLGKSVNCSETTNGNPCTHSTTILCDTCCIIYTFWDPTLHCASLRINSRINYYHSRVTGKGEINT